MEGNEYEIVEGKIEQLKSFMRFRDLGFVYVYGLILAIQLMLFAYVRTVIKSANSIAAILYYFALAGIVLFIIFSCFGLINKNAFKWYHAVYYLSFGALLIGLFCADFIEQTADVWHILGPVLFYILLSLGILIFLVRSYFKSETIEKIRNAKREERMDLIKYYILAVISNEDPKFENYTVDTASDLNSNMINKIGGNSALSDRFSQCFETFKDGFNLKTDEFKNKLNISYATITISAIVSFCVTGLNKIYDSWNSYLMAVWKTEKDFEIFEGITNQDAIDYYREMLDLTIAYQCLIFATIILIFVCIYVFRSILNTTNNTRLENFRLSQIVLSNIKQELKLISDEEKETHSHSVLN